MKITYEDKESKLIDESVPNKNKVRAEDMNEIKNVVNGLDTSIGNISNLKTIDKSNLVNAINEVYENTELIKTKYTVRRKFSNNTSSAWERMDNNVGKIANATKDGSSVQNDFDYIYPWSDITSYIYNTTTNEVVAEYGDMNYNPDGSLGEVFTKIPSFYWKRWRDNTYEYVSISASKLEGYIKSEQFSVGRYATSYINSKMSSISGQVPEVNRNITSFRTESRKLGNNIAILDYHYFLIQMLYLVEYADYNSQLMLGNGMTTFRTDNNDKSLVAETGVNRIIINTSGANNFKIGQQVSIGTSSTYNSNVAKNRTITKKENYSSGDITGTAIYFDGDSVNIALNNVLWTTGQKSGGCDTLGMKSGCTANDGKTAVAYRGIENPFGNVFQFVDGINVKDHVCYLCTSQDDYVVDKFTSPYNALGYTNALTNGYSKSLGYDNNYPIASFPTEIGTSSTTGTCDYYTQDNGNRIVLVGGYWSNGSNTGLWCWDLPAASGYAAFNLGSRLLKLDQ
jgi:hypothetical protein|nr:MAG TPA: tail collar fiber protein [Caudoviricetes sp.]